MLATDPWTGVSRGMISTGSQRDGDDEHGTVDLPCEPLVRLFRIVAPHSLVDAVRNHEKLGMPFLGADDSVVEAPHSVRWGNSGPQCSALRRRLTAKRSTSCDGSVSKLRSTAIRLMMWSIGQSHRKHRVPCAMKRTRGT